MATQAKDAKTTRFIVPPFRIYPIHDGHDCEMRSNWQDDVTPLAVLAGREAGRPILADLAVRVMFRQVNDICPARQIGGQGSCQGPD